MVYGVIYVITNLLTGMKYVGQTTRSVKERFREHFRRKESLVGQAMRIEGIKNFTIEVVEECKSQEELNVREIAWIMRCNCIYPYGYNITRGGAHRHTNEKHGSKKKRRAREKILHTSEMGRLPRARSGTAETIHHRPQTCRSFELRYG